MGARINVWKRMEESERPTEERYPAIIAAYMLQRNYLSIYLLPESVELRQSH